MSSAYLMNVVILTSYYD